jgi:hypothetical protein
MYHLIVFFITLIDAFSCFIKFVHNKIQKIYGNKKN